MPSAYVSLGIHRHQLTLLFLRVLVSLRRILDFPIQRTTPVYEVRQFRDLLLDLVPSGYGAMTEFEVGIRFSRYGIDPSK